MYKNLTCLRGEELIDQVAGGLRNLLTLNEEEVDQVHIRKVEGKIYTLNYVGVILDKKIEKDLMDKIIDDFCNIFGDYHEDYSIYFGKHDQVEELAKLVETAKNAYVGSYSVKAEDVEELMDHILWRFIRMV